MAPSIPRAGPGALERRLLSDIAEIQQDPYPNVHLHFDDTNIRKACLILTPEDDDPLHLTIDFKANYPLNPPTVTIQSQIEHPNVFGNYICATMLNREEGWTPAYTLKGATRLSKIIMVTTASIWPTTDDNEGHNVSGMVSTFALPIL
jgi:ubiquitin-protein ligase